MKHIIGTVLITFSILVASSSQAGWLVYHESELKGSVLDVDTKLPVEGAVILAVYRKASVGFGAGGTDSIINVREVLTNKEGNFHIAAYTTLIQPFSWKIPTTLIIYKPGYASAKLGSWHFTGDELKEEQVHSWPWTKALTYKLRGLGIVELPKLKTVDERKKNIPSIPSWNLLEKQKIIIRLINGEESKLGMEESDPYKAREFILQHGRK